MTEHRIFSALNFLQHSGSSNFDTLHFSYYRSISFFLRQFDYENDSSLTIVFLPEWFWFPVACDFHGHCLREHSSSLIKLFSVVPVLKSDCTTTVFTDILLGILKPFCRTVYAECLCVCPFGSRDHNHFEGPRQGLFFRILAGLDLNPSFTNN
jgi:hypothetical protein